MRRVIFCHFMDRHPHILNAAANLLGISFIIIGGLKFTNQNAGSYSDEVAWFSAFMLLMAIILWRVVVGQARRLPPLWDRQPARLPYNRS